MSRNEKEDLTMAKQENENPMEEKTIEVEISQDLMKGYVSLTPSDDRDMVTSDEIMQKLKNAGIIYGIDREKVSKILCDGMYYSKIKVATGSDPKNGENGKVQYYFDTKKDKRPKVSENGTVDFHNLDIVVNVTKGQLLATLIPPSKGINGTNILGKEIPSRDGKSAKLVLGKGVYATEEGAKIYSEIDGQPVLSEGKISVLSVLEIRGDVGPATGNINFVGSVKVKGNVKGGYEINADGDIEIDGTAEAAILKAQGDILIKRGMQGRGKGDVRAGGNFLARYIENSRVEAGQDIIISEAAMHSTILAGRKVELGGRKGLLVGGICRAGEEVVAKTIGSPMATYTELEVGTSPEQKKSCMELNQRIEELKKGQSKIKQALSVFSRRYKGHDSPEKDQLFKKLDDTLRNYQEEQKRLLEKRGQIEAEMLVSCKAKVSCSKTTFPGVYVIIGNASLKVRDKIEYATFYNYEGEIKIGTYEGL